MAFARTEQILKQSFDREFLIEKDSAPPHGDWADALPNTKQIAVFGFDHFHNQAEVYLNPDFMVEVAESYQEQDQYTLTVDNVPWELRGNLCVYEFNSNRDLGVWGILRLYIPTQDQEVDWETDFSGEKNILQMTMNGGDPWKIKINPSFKDDLQQGIEREAGTNGGGTGEVYIKINDDSPWRVKYGQIIIGDHQGNWILESSPLIITADELDWNFYFERWPQFGLL